MAIITSFPGIEAIVLVNGAKAREYIDEHIHTRERNDEQVQRFIDSVDDAEFAIRILINNDYKFLGHDALGIKVHVDGEYRCSTVWNKNHPKEYMYMCGSRVQKDDGGSSVIAFKFTAIETVEGEGKSYERALVDKQKEGTEQTGEIAVYVSRLKIKEKMMGLVGDGGKTTENQHSKLLFKANFKKKFTHGTGYVSFPHSVCALLTEIGLVLRSSLRSLRFATRARQSIARTIQSRHSPSCIVLRVS